MIITNVFQSCDVIELVKSKFNRAPKRVETFASRTYWGSGGMSNQSQTWTWRPNAPIPVLGTPSASIEYPLFFGALRVQAGNLDTLAVSGANSFVYLNNYVTTDILLPPIDAYNTQAGTVKVYGVGTFAGSPFPAQSIADDFITTVMLFGPYVQIQAFADATGVIWLDYTFDFSGFRIDMV